jgi:pyridoxine 4-dehydrogenase
MNTTTFLGDKPINRVGYGAMQLADPGVFGPPNDPRGAVAVLRKAVELGADHIDTTQFYGPDVVNELICRALHPYPDDLKLVTKVGVRRDAAGGVLPAQRPDELRAGVEANLRSLRVERLDLVNLRVVDTGPGTAIGLEDQLGELEALRWQGKLDLIGLSNVDRRSVERALHVVDVAEIQNAPRRRETRRHTGADRARVAARPLRADAADPRHQLAGAPGGEHGGDRGRPRRHRRRGP